MTLLVWLGLGMLLGIIASRLIPKMESASIMGYNNIPASAVLAVVGSLTVLFFYKHYLTDTVSQ